jgi:hypothetical protein
MPAMKNVTETGFELCLRCEETISSGSILTETVNFLAIEPGQGVFGRNRISVGQTGENEEGISADPVVLSYNMSYSQPALFAGMQTSADDFASTLRFYSSGDHEFTVLKQREMSGPIQALKEDKLGWMVMDFAPDQPVSVKPGIRTGECDMYPNPVEGYIRFNFQEPTPVRIFDMAGRMLVSGKIQNCLDVSMLPEGIYMLKAGSYQARKFIKH